MKSPTDSDGAAGVAEKLTAAQKRALIAIVDLGNSPWGWSAADLCVSGAAMKALRSKGLLMGGIFGNDRATRYRFEPLGLSVRQYLEQKS